MRTAEFQNPMSQKSSKARFEHRPVHGMPSRMVTYCLRCQEFIAASDKPKILKIAENAHICPRSKLK